MSHEANLLNAYGLRKIHTSHIFPPIPDRSHDWCAYFDGEEERGNYGYGPTELAAITDFICNCIDDDDEYRQLNDALQTMRSDNSQFGVGA